MNKNSKTITPPDLSEVLDENARDTKLAINCVQIGVIQTFDPATQRASIKIAMKQVRDIAEDGTRTITEYPLLVECPVMVLFGGVDILSMPITAGDNCILLFNDRQIDEWMYGGEDQTPVTGRLHDLSDGIAIVGIRPLTNSITNYLANGIRLSHGQGSSQIDLKDDLIHTIAELFFHDGDMEITGSALINEDLDVIGNTDITGTLDVAGATTLGAGGTSSGNFDIDGDLDVTGATTSGTMHAGNGATGSFHIVEVVDGIVISGSN